jgi:hypothetical protein
MFFIILCMFCAIRRRIFSLRNIMYENLRNHILNIRIKVIWIIIILNIQTRIHNYHETLVLIYFTHQRITYEIMESIHIHIMSKLIIVNALVRRIL